MPYVTKEGAGGPPQPGFFGGLLGRVHDPLFVLRDPNAAAFAMPELGLPADVNGRRLDSRKRLLDEIAEGAHGGAASRELDGFQARAFDLLTSPAAQKAFQFEHEPDRVRESYGRNIYGQSVLLARRLIEAGTRVACISWAPDANATWDTHGENFAKLKGSLLPQFDAALSSLLTDLSDRGMLERTLVVAMGEFGRSPKVNAKRAAITGTSATVCSWPAAASRPGYCPRRQRQDRRESQPTAGDAGRHYRHDLHLSRRAAGFGVSGPFISPIRVGALGSADPRGSRLIIGLRAFPPSPRACNWRVGRRYRLPDRTTRRDA